MKKEIETIDYFYQQGDDIVSLEVPVGDYEDNEE